MYSKVSNKNREGYYNSPNYKQSHSSSSNNFINSMDFNPRNSGPYQNYHKQFAQNQGDLDQSSTTSGNTNIVKTVKNSPATHSKQNRESGPRQINNGNSGKKGTSHQHPKKGTKIQNSAKNQIGTSYNFNPNVKDEPYNYYKGEAHNIIQMQLNERESMQNRDLFKQIKTGQVKNTKPAKTSNMMNSNSNYTAPQTQYPNNKNYKIPGQMSFPSKKVGCRTQSQDFYMPIKKAVANFAEPNSLAPNLVHEPYNISGMNKLIFSANSIQLTNDGIFYNPQEHSSKEIENLSNYIVGSGVGNRSLVQGVIGNSPNVNSMKNVESSANNGNTNKGQHKKKPLIVTQK